MAFFVLMTAWAGTTAAASLNDLHGAWVVDVRPTLELMGNQVTDKAEAAKSLATLVITYDVYAKHATVEVPGGEKRRIDVQDFILNSDGSITIVSDGITETAVFRPDGTVRINPENLVLKRR